MDLIVRGLFHEREKIQEGKTKDFFSSDNLVKIIRLMMTYSVEANIPFKGNINSTDIFKDRLSYHLPENAIKNFYRLDQLHDYFLNSSINDFISSMELFIQTIKEICEEYFSYNYEHLNKFISEFNNLLAIKIIPFRVEVNKNKIFIDRINSPKEEENKKKIYEIVNSQNFLEVNEHFTNSLIKFAKRDYPESIEEAYLSLEKYLKIKIDNHKLDVSHSYVEFKKKFDIERGIFKVHSNKIKDRIEFVYIIRSEIKSHSDKKIFDRKDFLEGTARFQLNEIMNLLILLNSFKRKNGN